MGQLGIIFIQRRRRLLDVPAELGRQRFGYAVYDWLCLVLLRPGLVVRPHARAAVSQAVQIAIARRRECHAGQAATAGISASSSPDTLATAQASRRPTTNNAETRGPGRRGEGGTIAGSRSVLV